MDFAEFKYEIMELIDRASDKFEGRNKNEDQFDTLESACETIYGLVQEFDCECMDVDVDEITKRLTISIECYDMILHGGRGHNFFHLIQKTSSFSFAKRGEFLRVSFCFDGLWE